MKLETFVLILNLVVTLAIAVVAYRKSRVPGAISVALLGLSLAVWSLSLFLYQGFPSLHIGNLCAALTFLGITMSATAQFAFSLSYTFRSSWLNRSTIALLAVMPVLTQVLFWATPWRDVFFVSQAQQMDTFDSMGLWAKVNTFYIYDLIGASVLLLLDTFIRKPRPLLFRSWTILAGSAIPFLVQIPTIIGFSVRIELFLFGFTLTALGFFYGLFGQDLIEVLPVTREAVVEGMDDGWIVLDMRNTIVDINPAAEKMIGTSRQKAYGQSITSVLGDLPNLGQTLDENRELEMKRSMRSQEGWRYLNIRISTLDDAHKNHFGRLILWRDITERRLAEDSRQRARDEMFVLLNAISSSASNAVDLDDFLSESIYQIVYPFRSQVVEIFLIDERNKKDQEPNLFLASHFGLTPEIVDQMMFIPSSSPLFDWMFKNRQPILIEDLKNDPRIPGPMREMSFSCILAIPLITQTGEESNLLGLICLARKDKPVFSQDEIVRLGAISDHIASLIDSDRRRKLAIALSERQRLLRDLHDSVSQKLYGLVTLTEAAQAGLEAGSTVDPAQVLSRIGENARQAVKEMRLFLYQIQPIDVEKDGLISVLHHRLAAVEGRADIKARLLADDAISISKDKEVALYFIAQEALNNVLRHARAKSVSVTLKQGKRNVILEIIDDGCGFDSKAIDRAGLGLRNMKERVLQVNGKMRIISRPNEGTRIVVRVQKDLSTAPVKRRRKT